MLNNVVGYWAYIQGTYIRGAYIRVGLYSGGGAYILECGDSPLRDSAKYYPQ